MASSDRDAARVRAELKQAALSDARRRALSILHPAFPLAPDLFAHYMWPTSPSWVRRSKAGRGIRLKAHTFLAGLERDGLARRCGSETDGVEGFVLTSRGEDAVDQGRRPDRTDRFDPAAL
jgi:hypothetical protein